jgi:hypothetical protein
MKKFIKTIVSLLMFVPAISFSQAYSSNVQTNQLFEAPIRGAGISNCGSAINPIINCGFESGDFTGWTVADLAGGPFVPLAVQSGGVSPGFGFFVSAPTEGIFAATSGFDGNGPGTIEISQDISVPSTGESLTFDYRGAWDMTFGATVDRTFDVEIQPSGGGVALQSTTLLTTAPVGSTVPDTGDLMGIVDVSAYAGQAVRVAFILNVPESSTGPAWFQLDNVAVQGPPPMIPTLSNIGLWLMLSVLLFLGFIQINRKKQI